MTHILHINDNNLLVQSDNDISRSQGYAWLKGDAVFFDTDVVNAPIKHCRLAPQQINNRYWQQCEQSSIPSNAAGLRHSADLIWKHLQALKEQHDLHEIVFVVPSHYQSSNLQLLLGIAKSLDLQVVGLVNKAVAAIAHYESQDGHFLHTDVQLHQTVTSQVKVVQGQATLGEVEVIQGLGITVMQDSLLKNLQSLFIQNDRFDPLHYAETEQQLFDQLSDAAEQISSLGKATISVQHQNQLHSTGIDNKVWQAALSPTVDPLLKVNSAFDHCYLDMNFALGDSDTDEFEGPTLSQIQKVTGYAELLIKVPQATDGPLNYTTALSLDSSTDLKSVAPSALESVSDLSKGEGNEPAETSSLRQPISSSPTGATHLLQAGIAVPIEHSEILTDNNELVLHTSAQGNAESLLATGKLFLMNDESRTSLKPNDRIGSHFGEGVITVIQVV